MKYLTKSKFKLAIECPTKLFYTGKSEYANTSIDNSFLEALSEGGFQVGELAKHYIPNGHEIHTLDYDQALKQTNKLLELDRVVIYEAAIRYQNLFIRVDILVKRGNHIHLYEVKAKSIDPSKTTSFLTKNGEKVLEKWKPYLFDIAFQKYVVQHAFPDFNITAYLHLIDKTKTAPTNGLNQKFRIVEDKNRQKGVKVSSSLNKDDLSTEMLCKLSVDDVCELIINSKVGNDTRGVGFKDRIKEYSASYENDIKISPILSKTCGECEFKTTTEEICNNKLSGYRECWEQKLNWADQDFNQPNVLDIWNFRGKDKFIQEGKIKFSDIYEEDIDPESSEVKARQWLQIDKAKRGDESIWIDKEGLRSEMNSWTFPLHFIDFETTAMAIPFNKGRHPYEGIAFQFSHHMVYEDGRIEHKGEYLNTEQGLFPNYEFIRQLKAQLDKDQGTIFRYAAHENTYLNMIYEQLQLEDSGISDKEDLCNFIRTITKSKKDSIEQWCGERNMVDMLELVKNYYYNPATNGSNSIKQVLPATLNSSTYLKNKYSKPIYGTQEIPSHNFENWIWVEMVDGAVKDPYKKLPLMFQDADKCEYLVSGDNNELKDGGAAMVAYARMQFEEMSDYEKSELSGSLLKYCELDTFAMVVIYEAWVDMVS